MKKLSEVPFDKIYKGMPVMIPASSYLQDDARFSHYGETISFSETHGIVIERYHGEWPYNKLIRNWIVIQFDGHRFPYRVAYENMRSSKIYLDPTRM